MTRLHKDWLTAYDAYTEGTESPTAFHKWVGISTIAAVLQKKVNFPAGRIDAFPNLYIILVGPPGCRKSQAIKFGEVILKSVDEAKLSADSITREKLIQSINAAKFTHVDAKTGAPYTHSSLTILSKEFETFLGQKTDNTKMLVFLTDMFDAPDGEWKYETKGSGSDILIEPWLNLLGATTPHSLSSSLPASAIGGGLTSRILFIYARHKANRVAIPELTPEVIELQRTLSLDLAQIAKLSGDYTFGTGCKQAFIDWYNKYDDSHATRLCKDVIYDGWYERKPLFVRKLALICAASESNETLVHWRHFERAINLVEESELSMPGAFAAVGKSDITQEVETVLTYIRTRKWILESDLRRLIFRDVDNNKFDNVIKTIMGGGWVVRKYRGPKEVVGTFYVWSDSWADWLRAGGGET